MLVSDYRWQVLENARSAILDAFRHEGVITVQYVAAFPQAQFAVWLGTATDAEAETLRRSESKHGRTSDLLVEHGFSEQDVAELSVVVQSQETVDRDYEGSWFYALR